MTTVKTTEPKIDERKAQPYMGIRVQVPVSELGQVIPSSHREVFGWLRQNNIKPAGAPFVRFHVIKMDGRMDIEMGVPIANAATGNDRVKAGTIPAGRYASLIYTGVMNGVEGNKVLIDWAKKQGLKWDRWDDPAGDAFAARYESSLTEPDDEPDMAKWDTEVAIKLKDK